MSAFISLRNAAAMTAAYRADKENILDPQYRGLNILCISETFDRTQVLSMLNNTGCDAMRVYYGMDENKKVHAILVGVDADDQDMLPPQGEIGNFIIEEARRCPDHCPPASPLNQ